MADAIDGTLGFGSVAGSSTVPVILLTLPTGHKSVNFLTLRNRDTTNWLFVKENQDAGPYQIAGPGEEVTIARGPQSANNLTKIIGFGATPSNAGTATVLVTLGSKKQA